MVDNVEDRAIMLGKVVNFKKIVITFLAVTCDDTRDQYE